MGHTYFRSTRIYGNPYAMPKWKKAAIRCTRAKNRNSIANFNNGRDNDVRIISHKHNRDMWSSPIDCEVSSKFNRDYANVEVHSNVWDRERCPRLHYLQEADIVCTIPPRKIHPRRLRFGWW